MKRSIYLVTLLLVIGLSFKCKAQNNESKMILREQITKINEGKKNNGNGRIIKVRFDATTKKLVLVEQPNVVGEGGNINIEIEDFNPFLYTLSIKETQGVYQNKENLSEKAFNSAIFNQQFLNIKDISINVFNIGIAATVAASEPIKRLKDATDNLKQNIQQSEFKSKQLKDKLLFLHQKYLVDTANHVATTFQQDSISVANEMKTTNTEIENNRDALEAKEKELQSLIKLSGTEDDAIVFYNNEVSSFIKKIYLLNNITAYYRTLTNTTSVDGISLSDLNERKVKNFEYYFPEWNEKKGVNISAYLNSLLQKLENDYAELQTSYNITFNKITDGSKKTALEKNFQEVRSAFEKVDFVQFKSLIDNTEKLYLSINVNNFKVVYSTNIIDDDADVVRFEITSKPISGSDPNLPIQPISLLFAVPIQGGVKIDVGSGFTFNFGPHNHTYRYEETAPSSGKYRVTRNANQSLFSPSVVIMAHLYRRNATKNTRSGLCVGLGTSDAERIRYFLGFGLRFGRKQWMNFCIGAVGGQVDRASETVLNKDLTLSAEELTKAIPFSNPAPFKLGGFLAITFNLTGSNSVFSQKAAQIK